MLLEDEIAEEYTVEGKQVLTPDGWRDIKKVYKTIPLPVLYIKTSNYSLECSEHHMIKTAAGAWAEAIDLGPGDMILTESGVDIVLTVLKTGRVEPMYDITVDDPSGEFYSNGIVSHNSTTFAARQLILSHLIPGYKSLYICPQHDQLKTYARRYAEMEAAFRFNNGKQNVYNKVYSTRSTVEMNYCLTSANAVRGKSVIECLIDECVAWDTLLHTQENNTKVRICDVRIGDRVLAFNPVNNLVDYDTVIDKKYKGKRSCWRITTSSGNYIEATDNHRIYTSRGWLFVAELRDCFLGIGEECDDKMQPRYSQSGNKQVCTSNDAGHFIGRRLYRKSREILLQKKVYLSSLFGTKRLCRSEGYAAKRFESKYDNSTKYRLRRILCCCSNNKMFRRFASILGSLLQQARSFSRRNCKNEKIRDARVGGPVDLGSCSVVDSGRWESLRKYISNTYGIFFKRGDRQTNSLVQKKWNKDKRCWYRRSGEKSNTVLCDKIQYNIFQNSSEKYRKIRAFVYALQDKCLSSKYFYGVRHLWGRIFNHKISSFLYEIPRKYILRKLQKISNKSYKEKIHGTYRCGKNEGNLEKREITYIGRIEEKEKKVLRRAQREYFREGAGKKAKTSFGETNRGSRRIVSLLWEYIQNELKNTQITNACRKICVFFRTMQKTTRKLFSKRIQIAEENNKEIIFTDIESIEYCGDTDVYDITTEKYNTFIANGVAVHNCQGMDPDIIPELLYVQTTAQYPSTIFAGTSLSIDTLLEAKWLASSQGMWHVRAGDGTHWLNMHDQDTLFKVCDNAKGPTCPYTGKLLNVRDGLYVHANKQALAVGAVGIHVPQCIIPDLAYNPIQWGKIYKKVRTDDPKKVMQECFGIAVAEGSREITESDLQRICVLTDTVEEAKQKCRNGYYKLVVSGCDWGGSDYNQAIKTKTSYTVHCILGVAPDDRVDILHYRRFAGMDYREIADIIATEHNAFNAHVIASDFGVGLAYNTEIRNRIPFDRHFIMNYVGPNSAPLATPKGQHMANQLALNKTEAITNVFSDLKSPHLKIRARHWEEMSPFLLDWLNMYRAPVENAIGSGTFKYIRSATKADDALHAFTFAYVLVKFFLGEPLVNDVSLQNKLRQVLNMGAVYSRDDLDVLTRNAPPDYIISG